MVHTQDMKIAPDMDLDVVARGTPGFSGADLANLVNEAAINAVRANRDIITADDFDRARDRLLLGRRDAMNALLPDEKHSVAVHESGHAVVAALSEHADPVAKVTILPAGQALGVTQQLPEDERHLYPESYLQDSLAVRLGGRAAEVLVLGEASTGAASDLAGATDLATKMVRDWGLSSRLGPIGFADTAPNSFGPDGFARAPYAEATQQVIDEEVGAAAARRGGARHRVAAHTPRAVRPGRRCPPRARDHRRIRPPHADGPRRSGRSRPAHRSSAHCRRRTRGWETTRGLNHGTERSMAEFPAPSHGIVLTHFIVSDDIERSRRFYTDVLGGETVRRGEPTYVALANSWIIINVGGGPTDDKPTVTLETPREPDRVSSFLNIRVADIEAVYAEWSAKGAEFLTPPKHHETEIRCYVRDPDGHLIEVGQTTRPPT